MVGNGQQVLGETLLKLCFGLQGCFAPTVRPMRLLTLNTWVSTGITSLPKSTAATTLAVLRPTPGSLSSCSTVSGTTPPNSLTNIRAIRAKLRALLLG